MLLEHRRGQVEEAFLTRLTPAVWRRDPLAMWRNDSRMRVAGSHLPTSDMPCMALWQPHSVQCRIYRGFLGNPEAVLQ